MSFTWRRLTSPLAIVLGPSIIVIAVLRNWHGWEAPPFWLDDGIAGLALFLAGVVGWNGQDSVKGRLITAAYALATGVLWASMFEGLAGLHPMPENWSAIPGVSLTLTAMALGGAIVGLVFSLPSKHPPLLGTRPEPVRAPRPERRKKVRRSSDRASA
jgi:hypothetical protein